MADIEVDITVGRAKDIAFTPITTDGQSVTLDGPAEITVLSGEGTLGPNLQGGVPLPADGLTGAFYIGTNLGDTLYQIRGDAAAGEPVREVISTVLAHAVPAEAVGFAPVVGPEYTP